MLTTDFSSADYCTTELNNNSDPINETPENKRRVSAKYEYVNIWITRYKTATPPMDDQDWPAESRLLIKSNDRVVVRHRAESFVKGFNQKERRSPCGLWAVLISANVKLRPGEKLVA